MVNKIMVYTDGSCVPNPGVGGWAAVINRNKDIEIISGSVSYSTNNRMEIQAVIEAIKHLLLENKEVYIHSDSGYVVNAIERNWVTKWENNGWKTSKGDDVKNKDLWVKLRNEMIKTQCRINLVKVKGHVGDKFNEMVHDRALEEATNKKLKIETGSLSK